MDMERDHEGDRILKFKLQRQQLNDKFDALRNLVPYRTKADRASVIGGAIEYINELKRNLEELMILVERKRCNNKKKSEYDLTLDVESINIKEGLTCQLNSRL